MNKKAWSIPGRTVRADGCFPCWVARRRESGLRSRRGAWKVGCWLPLAAGQHSACCASTPLLPSRERPLKEKRTEYEMK